MAENDYIINVIGLKKAFKVSKREEGFGAAIKSLWSRNHETVYGVDGIDMKVQRGEIRGLIGPNGAGKSTTIKILSGILHPEEGQVNVMGYVPWKERQKYVKKLGVVFGQKSQLWWDLPPIDTYALNREMYKVPHKRYLELVDYFKELLQIGDVVHKPVRQLSLGERMKCEFVCAMLHEPELVFLDEPTIGLDIISKENIRKFVKQVNQDLRTTFILTTHDMSDLENLCENVTIINKGKVVYDNGMSRLGHYFSKKKLIDVQFKEPLDRGRLDEYTLLSSDELTATIELDLDEDDLRQFVYELLGKLPVQDINIRNIPIEDVIRDIYTA
ncbi:ABC transporter ATP-binding protein [Cohnella terricola]|uniref:ATP-binding cassette domain-containing protein n=1 Tax=Cohnella terricola TaxID=1289167 RepID=A0A559J4K4_9BACL|nr:ATP-binding cassette domain-containing protein [Cohnella terricola]TVX94792.1 ATP-binding cassette domain-containing protein [Cohnella terricola]